MWTGCSLRNMVAYMGKLLKNRDITTKYNYMVAIEVRHGPVYVVCGVYVCIFFCFSCYGGRSPIIIIAEPELVKQILVKDFDSFRDRMVRMKV